MNHDADSDWMAAGSEDDVENEDRITKINTLLQRRRTKIALPVRP